MAALGINRHQPPPSVKPASSKRTKGVSFKEQLQYFLYDIWRVLLVTTWGLLPALLLVTRRLLHLVQHIYVVGWQKFISSAFIDVLMAFGGKPLKRLGIGLEGLGNCILGQYTTLAGNEYNLTLIGLLDRSFDLAPNTIKTFPAESPSARTNAEVCAMAAKIIYENDDLVKEVIQESWNKGILAKKDRFEFIDWYNYKTKGEDQVDTQAMLLKKGHAIIVVFRGTEPFSAVDWATDFRFTWWDGIPALGRVHTGFLESLGLGSPLEEDELKKPSVVNTTAGAEAQKLESFAEYINLCLTRYRQEAKRRDSTAGRKSGALFRDPKSVPSPDSAGTATKSGADSGATPTDETKKLAAFLNEHVLKGDCERAHEGTPLSAHVRDKKNWQKNAPLYWQIRLALENLLALDPEAKIYIAGHSLGGALAAMFTGLLTAEDDVMTERIGGLYTFGQPRVGDWSYAWYLHNKLNLPELRFVRLIYSNDLVPRVPFDDPLFQYKHLGPFHWSDAFYNVTVGTFNEQPALGVVTPYLTGIVELLYNVVWNGFANALLRDEAHKRPYESAFQVVARMGSILFPRIGAHNPTNYLNAVRYGFPQGKHKKKSPTV